MKKVFTLIIASMMVSAVMAWDHMYIVGDATPGGWDLNNLAEMNRISESEFEWTGYLGAGDVKFITGNDWSNTQYGADDWNKPLTRNTVFTATQLGEDKKFKLTEETKGWYTLHINTAEMKISTWPRYIYPIGNGCEAGWDINYNNATLTETGLGTGIYTGTLELMDNGGHELKFNCARDWSVFVGPEEDWDGAHDIGGAGTYKAKMYTSDDHKFWVLNEGFGTYHVGLDLNNNKLYLVPEQVTFKMHASEAAKVAMENEVSFYWWNAAGSGEWGVSEEDGWYTAIVTNAYMPINYLWRGKDWNSKTTDQTNFDQGFTTDQAVIAAYNGNIIDTDKRQIELWYESEYSTYGAFTLAASAEHVAPGTEVTFTPSVADYAGTPVYTYYINGVEATLTAGKYTFADQGFYRVEAVTTINHQIIKASKDIYVEKTLTFKVHATNSLKSAWENIYFYSWQNYDGYDHAQAQQLTAEEDGFYTVEIAAVAPVKFLLKNKPQDDWTGLQSVDMNNAEAGYTEGICVEIGSSKNGENKYLVNVLSDCQFTTYELTLGVDKETISEGETVTFTPAVGSLEGLTYTYYVDGVETDLTDNQLTLSEWGKYTIKVTAEVEGAPLESTTAVTVTRDITISAQINEAAMAILGEAKCFAWWEGGSMTQDMVKNGDIYETTLAVAEPISFLIYNGGWVGYGGEQTVDMKNDGAGYSADRMVQVVEVKDGEGKLTCYHWEAFNPDKITIHVYAEASDWETVHFFSHECTGYNQKWVEPTKGSDNWYSYTYEGVSTLKFVAAGTYDWAKQIDDVVFTTGEYFVQILGEKQGNRNKYILRDSKDARTFDVSLNKDGFASIYMPSNFTLPTGVEAYKGVISGSDIVLTKVGQEVLPGETGLILYSESIKSESITLNESYDAAAAVADNSFVGTLTATTPEGNYYVLANVKVEEETTTAFVKVNGREIPANRAYLPEPAGASGARLRIRFAENTATDNANVNVNDNDNVNVNKVVKDGQLYIVRDGRMYNVLGK